MSPEPPISIRPAMHEDLRAILMLNQQLNPYDDPLPPENEVQAVWHMLLESPLTHTFVATLGAQVAATCVLVITPNLTRGCRPFGLIENVVTDKRMRRRGIGHALLTHALGFAWEQGCYKVMLLTGRPEAVAFYEQAGFQKDVKIGLVAKPPADYS